MLTVSVVVASRDRPDQLHETLRSLLGQRRAADDYEIVVVDDGSVVPLAAVSPPGGPVVRVLRTTGVERSAARNAGAGVAKGDLLLFVDDDLTAAPDFISQHVAAHVEWPGALVVGSIILPPDRQREPFVAFRQRLESAGLPRARGLVHVENFCTAANMSLSRLLFETVGGFDERIRSGEDQDLALRLTASGGRIAFVPEAELVHRDDAFTLAAYCRRVEWGSRHVVAFCEAHPLWPDNVARLRVNGPVRIVREPFGVTARKLLKSALSPAPLVALLFATAAFLERLKAGVMLDRMYRLLIGIHIQKGFRAGLRAVSRSRGGPSVEQT